MNIRSITSVAIAATITLSACGGSDPDAAAAPTTTTRQAPDGTPEKLDLEPLCVVALREAFGSHSSVRPSQLALDNLLSYAAIPATVAPTEGDSNACGSDIFHAARNYEPPGVDVKDSLDKMQSWVEIHDAMMWCLDSGDLDPCVDEVAAFTDLLEGFGMIYMSDGSYVANV